MTKVLKLGGNKLLLMLYAIGNIRWESCMEMDEVFCIY